MKILKWFVLWLSLLPLSGLAECPIQPSSVAYVNGIGTTKSQAEDSRKNLDDKLRKRLNISSEDTCLRTLVAYNRSINLPVDFLQAVYQKAREIGISAIEIWPAILRLATPSWFDEVIAAAYPKSDDDGLYVVGAQLGEHLSELYRPELTNGRHLTLAGHSQGNFYTNSAWKAFTEEERKQVSIVAIATPALEVAGGGPQTKLYEDALAAAIFSFSLPPNVTNTEPCDKDIFHPLSWLCHDMDQSYLFGTNSREKIINDIIDSLPKAPKGSIVEGHVFLSPDNSPAPGAAVEFWCPKPLPDGTFFHTATDANGFYQFSLIPEDTGCSLNASLNIFQGSITLDILGNGTVVKDILISPLYWN